MDRGSQAHRDVALGDGLFPKGERGFLPLTPGEVSQHGLLKLQYFGHLCKERTHWTRPLPRYWERLKAGGEGDDRG